MASHFFLMMLFSCFVSVVFAALLGRLFLKESLTARRLSACSVIAFGAYCLGHPA